MKKKVTSVTKSAIGQSSAPSRRATTTISASKETRTTRRSPEKERALLKLDPKTAKLLNAAPTLAEAARKDPAVAARIDAKTAKLEKAYRLEQEIDRAIAARHVSRSQLAARLGVDRSSISRDLNRGLSRATIARVNQVVDALDFEFVPVVIPKEGKRERAEHFARILSAIGISLDDLQDATRVKQYPRRKKTHAPTAGAMSGPRRRVRMNT
jgi:predicted XRE-type DNA-binding protein